MIEVSVCVGSSCHLKGSYRVIQRFQELIAEHDLSDQVRLSGSFCLGGCGKGVTVRIAGTLHNIVDPAEVDELFGTYIKPQAEV